MDRLTVTFLALLVLATLFSGQLWAHGGALVNGHGAFLDIALAAVSALLLMPTLVALGRIVYRTAKVSNPDKPKNQ